MYQRSVQAQKRLYPRVWLVMFFGLILILSGQAGATIGQLDEFEHIQYSKIDVHLGFENSASGSRLNYPFYILLSGQNWRVYNEQFRQLGELTERWDQVQRGLMLLEESRNVRLQGVESTQFSRQLRIIHTDWEMVGQKCGYRPDGKPLSGCAYNKRLPRCTIIVPHQELYAGGDRNEYHQLLGHEMWHCLVGSFH